ncbi:MAG: hypothetical protein JO097_11240 [Acidobacteriaceae bacterium]|nr:hypothetical protein [Acidobacteriaceae bacterium]MBV9294458.1 hypothetical protein [Acidobacteriaceae bacterium]MBV9763462.1 hypothetical protein [Acidobacteriaceae bacterium]
MEAERKETRQVATLNHGDFKADIYSTELPGEFKVVYRNPDGSEIEEALLTGISTYHMREPDVLKRLEELSRGAQPSSQPDLGDPGEY